MPPASPAKLSACVSTWPRHVDGLPSRQSGRSAVDDPVDVRRRRRQVAALHVGVDVEDRLDVVVVDITIGTRCRGRSSATFISICWRPAAVPAASPPAASIGVAASSPPGTAASARPRVVDAVVRVDPVVRRRPGALELSDTSTLLGDVLLGQPDLRRQRPVHVHAAVAGASTIWCRCDVRRRRGPLAIVRRSSGRRRVRRRGRRRTTWTSIGAGRPKLRIWLMMSAGWKKNVHLREPPGQLAPQLRRRSSAVGRVRARFSATRISPSHRLTVAVVAERDVDAADGSPMLSRIMSTSLVAGTISRIACSTWPKIRSVSSSRVPGRGPHVQPELAGVHLREEVLPSCGNSSTTSADQQNEERRRSTSGGARPRPGSCGSRSASARTRA